MRWWGLIWRKPAWVSSAHDRHPLQPKSAIVKTSLATPPLAVEAAATCTFAVPGKLGLGLLVALVVGSIVGSGIFGLPQNMAAGAALARS